MSSKAVRSRRALYALHSVFIVILLALCAAFISIDKGQSVPSTDAALAAAVFSLLLTVVVLALSAYDHLRVHLELLGLFCLCALLLGSSAALDHARTQAGICPDGAPACRLLQASEAFGWLSFIGAICLLYSLLQAVLLTRHTSDRSPRAHWTQRTSHLWKAYETLTPATSSSPPPSPRIITSPPPLTGMTSKSGASTPDPLAYMTNPNRFSAHAPSISSPLSRAGSALGINQLMDTSATTTTSNSDDSTSLAPPAGSGNLARVSTASLLASLAAQEQSASASASRAVSPTVEGEATVRPHVGQTSRAASPSLPSKAQEGSWSTCKDDASTTT